MHDASLIMVNYRSSELVVERLRELCVNDRERPAQIILVDNDPASGLVDRIDRGRIEYLASSTNIGFAAAVNLGLARADQRHVILLNPDARPEPGCLAGLVAELKTTPDAAVAGPRLLPFDHGFPESPSATWIDPNLRTLLLEYTAARRLWPGGRDWLQQHYFVAPDALTGPADVAMVQGACFALDRSWLERVGSFDAERFFLYWEETDWCRRVRAQGGRVRYCPQLCCQHIGGASSVDADAVCRHFWRGCYQYLDKHHGRGYRRLARLAMLVGLAAEHALLSTLVLSRRGRDRQLITDREALGRNLRAQFSVGNA
jgi:N-acetylglucosaminyl-diphospho-decaprenol L-rhamnosyltransferase